MIVYVIAGEKAPPLRAGRMSNIIADVRTTLAATPTINTGREVVQWVATSHAAGQGLRPAILGGRGGGRGDGQETVRHSSRAM